MPIISSLISIAAEFRNPILSREANGSARLDCDLKIADHQVINGVALYDTAERLFKLQSPAWVHVREFVFSVLSPSRPRPMFTPLPHDPFCIESFEPLVSMPRRKDLSLLVFDHRFGWVSEPIDNVVEPSSDAFLTESLLAANR